MLSEGVIREIEKVIGSEGVMWAEEDRVCYSYDAKTTGPLPDLAVFPRTPEQVSRIMVLANEHGFPVIPRGAGSGMTGGATPVAGGVVVVMTKFDKILEVDLDELIAVVEPGVINYDLQQEVEGLGLFFPPDPASYKYSTIGGNVAECAGGPRAVKYGVMKDYVLGLEVVLPTGEIIETGTRTMKGVVGYDLTKLFVGSEGTLGIVTKVILKLLPFPEARGTLLAIFEKIEAAASSVAQIIRSRIIPSALEFMDNSSLRCAEAYLGAGLPTDAGGFLLIEVDGPQKAVDDQVKMIEEICWAQGAREVRAAENLQEVERLWELRRCLSQASYALNPVKVNEDVTVPRSKIPALVKGVEEIARREGLQIMCFGHAGDGNIHVSIMIGRGEEEMRRAEGAVEEIFKLTLDLKGTLSGEHGVGITKAPYIGMEISPAALEAMKRIKKALDPKGILNPGKIFP
ncbi:MAG: FAD-binding protein [Deltaproteobacteria bacterium]|nr:FAD-binding protein [Deltaproteobacteria bacterium]